jgi:hypothetical protein
VCIIFTSQILTSSWIEELIQVKGGSNCVAEKSTDERTAVPKGQRLSGMEENGHPVERRASRASRQDEQDEEVLAEFGYKQELKRDWGLMHNFGISFSIIVCLLHPT